MQDFKTGYRFRTLDFDGISKLTKQTISDCLQAMQDCYGQYHNNCKLLVTDNFFTSSQLNYLLTSFKLLPFLLGYSGIRVIRSNSK